MGFFSDVFDFGGASSDTRQVSSLSANQQELDELFAGILQARTGTGATPSNLPLVADLPGMFNRAYEALSERFGEFSDVIRESLEGQVEGQPAWAGRDMGEITSEWRENFAVPVMETYRSSVLPQIEESYNIVPGGFYSTARGRGVESATNQFYAGYVQPRLFDAYQAELNRQFQSVESAENRRLAAVDFLTRLPGMEFDLYASAAERLRTQEQVGISAARAEEMRTFVENDPWLRLALAYLGTPMTETIVEQQGPGFGYQLASAAVGGATMGYFSRPSTPTV